MDCVSFDSESTGSGADLTGRLKGGSLQPFNFKLKFSEFSIETSGAACSNIARETDEFSASEIPETGISKDVS
ncbi:MAG: hypothetical protein ACK41P_03580 [Asticcacaulis sp.]